MKRKGSILPFLATMISSLTIASCGGGGSSPAGNGGADFITISRNGAPAETYTETADSTAFYNYDPYIWCSYDITSNTIYLRTDYGFKSGKYTEYIELEIPGDAAGTYLISDGAGVQSGIPGGAGCTTAISGSSGEIKVDRYDTSMGGLIQGSFDVTAYCIEWFGSPGTTETLTGTFRVTRDDIAEAHSVVPGLAIE